MCKNKMTRHYGGFFVVLFLPSGVLDKDMLAALPQQNVFLAPMAGVTDAPFRRAVRRCGTNGLLFSEMIASHVMLESYRRKEDGISDNLKKIYVEELPLAVQLAGCDPDILAEVARIHEAHGAALIDLNFGCPVKKVINTMAGAALMRDEMLAGSIFKAVSNAVSIPVTVKMRLGWDDSSLNAPRIAHIAQESGIQRVTIHGRTRCQLYTGHADWSAVRRVKDAITLPVIVNGDITDTGKAESALKLSGAQGVMVGRGANGAPWKIEEINKGLAGEVFVKPQGQKLLDVILEHYQDVLSYYGIPAGLKIGRKHLGWYLDNIGGCDDLKSMLFVQQDHNQVTKMLTELFEEKVAA